MAHVQECGQNAVKSFSFMFEHQLVEFFGGNQSAVEQVKRNRRADGHYKARPWSLLLTISVRGNLP